MPGKCSAERKYISTCGHPCHPCNIPYYQPKEYCYCADIEPLPRGCNSSQGGGLVKLYKNKTVFKMDLPKMVCPQHIELRDLRKKKFRCLMGRSLPYFFHSNNKIKSCVRHSSWECCKRNGIQDYTPQWYVLGRPYRRPGPSYSCCAAYFPTYSCC